MKMIKKYLIQTSTLKDDEDFFKDYPNKNIERWISTGELLEVVKLSDIETFRKSFIKTLMDRINDNHKKADKIEDDVTISNLSGEVNALYWIKKIFEEQLKKELGIE